MPVWVGGWAIYRSGPAQTAETDRRAFPVADVVRRLDFWDSIVSVYTHYYCSVCSSCSSSSSSSSYTNWCLLWTKWFILHYIYTGSLKRTYVYVFKNNNIMFWPSVVFDSFGVALGSGDNGFIISLHSVCTENYRSVLVWNHSMAQCVQREL